VPDFEVPTKTEDADVAEESEAEKVPLEVEISSVSITGLMTIQYSKPVQIVNYTTFDWHNSTQFDIRLEQRSDESNQESEFDYGVVGMTSRQIQVQLIFSSPLEISQGVKPDLVHVKMLKSILMVELGQQPHVNNGTDEDYQSLMSLLPKQVESWEKYVQLLFNAETFGTSATYFFYAPLALHIGGIGSMDMTWVLFRQLQIFEIFSQFDLKLPANIVEITQAYSQIANQQLVTAEKAYKNQLEFWSSNNENEAESSSETEKVWKCVGDYCLHQERNRTLAKVKESRNQSAGNETALAMSEFEQSRFANRGSSDLVLMPMIQMLFLIAAVLGLGLCGIILRYTFYYWMPQTFKRAYEYLKHRIFWNLPLRTL
jgi:chaperonin cofactor prefoldin